MAIYSGSSRDQLTCQWNLGGLSRPPIAVAIAGAVPALLEISLGGRVQRSESHHRRDHSRSSRTGSCWDPPESWADDRHEGDTAPSTGRGSVAGPAANPEPADSSAAKSAVSTRQEPGDSRTSCLDGQNTADRGPIPGKDGGRRCGTPIDSLPELRCQQGSYAQQASGPSSRRGWIW